MTNRGTAYIYYSSPRDAELAISHMHEAQLDGTVVNVSIVLPRRAFSRSPPPARSRPAFDLYDSRPVGPPGGYGNRGPPPESRRPPPPARYRSPPPRRSPPPPRRYGGGGAGRPDPRDRDRDRDDYRDRARDRGRDRE